MRTIKLIATLAVLGTCGCAERRASSPNQPRTANPPTSPRGFPTNPAPAIAGPWHSREHSFLGDLANAGHWKGWDLGEQSGRPTDPPMLAGTWFVRNGILFLRIEETKEPPERIGPGLAFTFDVKSVTPDALVLHQMR